MSKSEEKDPNVHALRITRRGLLQGSGAAVVAAGVAAVSTCRADGGGPGCYARRQSSRQPHGGNAGDALGRRYARPLFYR